MTDYFDWTEFGGEDDEVDANRAFEQRHSPSFGYIQIQQALEKPDNWDNIFDDEEKQLEASVGQKIAVFRETMQYIEEFGIYLLSRLDDDTEFIKTITNTTPGQVKPLFETIRDDGFDEVVAEYSPDQSTKEWVIEEFGYWLTDSEDAEVEELTSDEKSISVDSIDEAVETSLDTILQKLERIARFFLRYDEAYNAVKHGNRVTPQRNMSASVGHEEEIKIDLDMEFATFLCKRSGDRSDGHPFTFTVPVEILERHSEGVAKETNSLYTHLYDAGQLNTARDMRENIENADIKFYGITEGGDEYQDKLTRVGNPDTTIWLPKDDLPDDINELEGGIQASIAVGLYSRGDELLMKTAGDNERSLEYPLLMEGTIGHNPDELIGHLVQSDFRFYFPNLPLWQYLEFLKIKEDIPYESIAWELEELDKTGVEPLHNPIDVPELPDPLYREEFEFLVRLGKAAGEEVMTPVSLIDEELELIHQYMDKEDLTRDKAQEWLNELSEVAEDGVLTNIQLKLLDTAESVDDISVRERIWLEPLESALVFEEDVDEFVLTQGSDPRYEPREVGEKVGQIMWCTEPAEEVYSQFETQGLEALNTIDVLEEPGSEATIIVFRHTSGPEFTWYKMDYLNIHVFPEMPSHLRDVVGVSTD
jgi:hypothetical protein